MVKVKYPFLGQEEESAWARLALPMGGKGRGWLFLPEVDDEVLVAFEHGDIARPYVLGMLWNGIDIPPSDGDGRDKKVIKSRSGHLIRLDDTSGNEKIEIVDKSGKNMLVVDTSAKAITISSDKDIVLKAPNGKIQLDATDVQVKATGGAKVEALGGDVTLKGTSINLN
jgi:uncharacterized protein involved in type VI secretion and phage assembly